MRSYHVGTVAAALSCPAKWVDNVLSRHTLPGVLRERQGVSRQVSFDGLLHLAVVQALMTDLALPAHRAVRLAVAICAAQGHAAAGDLCVLRVDLERLRRDLTVALREAVETAARPTRGRPPADRRPT